MKDEEAKKLLEQHADALNILLKKKGFGDMATEARKALGEAKDQRKIIKKTLAQKIKELPVVQKFAELGTAGTVAIGSAGVVQTELAVDQTEVFIAEIANDIVEERFEVPAFFNEHIDFYQLNEWGQSVIIEKVEEAKTFVSELEQQTQSPNEKANQIHQESTQESSKSERAKGETPSGDTEDKKPTNQSDSPEEKDSKEEGNKNDQKDSQKPEESSQKENKPEQIGEETKGRRESSGKDIDELPIIETPIDNLDDEITPHRDVSPVQ